MTEDYKISLGVKLDASDIRKQINDASGDIKPIELKIDAETKELTKTIKEALNSLSKGAKNAFTLDTSNIQTSLDNLSKTIVDIRNSLGTLDGKGMKDLVSSINQMATALGKAENESDSLVKSLSVLSKKDFSVNIGLDMGKKNTSMIAYGRAARKQVIPELEAQIKYLENLFGGKQATVNKLARQGKNVGFDIFTDFGDFNSDSAIKKMESMEKYIASLKKLATIDNVNLDGFNEIHKDASALINDITGVENAVNKASGVPEKLKNLFGSGISSEQLDSIVLDLKEIKNAIVDLSKGVSFEGLTQSFDRLSNSIENLLANAEKVKGVLNNNLGNSAIDGTSTVDTAPIKSAQQTGKEIGDAITKSAQQSINLDDVIDEQVSSIMQKYAIVGDKGSKAFEEIKQAVLECRRELGILENGNFSIDEEVFGSSRAVDKVTDAIANQMRAVNNLGDEYVKLADYITDFNNSAKGYKVHIPDAVKQEQGDDYRSNRGVLGNAFTTGKGNDFADFITGLNQDLGQTIDLTKGEAEAFDELLRKVELGRKQREALKKSDKYLTSNASTDEILSQNYINKNEIYDDTISAVDAINAAEREAAQTSIQTTNIVVQNEEKKQQAYKETANAYDAISKDTSLVRDDVDFQKIFESSNQAAQEAQRHFQALLADEKAVVSVTEQFDDNNALQSFVVNIKRASGEVETLRYAMNKLDDVENFAYQGGSASDSKVEKQLETRIKKANDLQIKLDKIKSGYSDMGAAKPIKDINHIEILDEQYRKVEKAIVDVRNADDTTFSSMISNAEKERTALENMVREFRNAENVATSLRSKDIDTVKGTYGSKLDVLISKMKSSGVYTSGFESGADNLRSVLSSATDASGLVKFLNGLDKLEAGYKRADAAVKEFNRSQKVGINVSGLESKIKDVQRISPEIDQFEAEIDGAKVSVKSLLSDLGKVKTQGDFSVVNARFKAFADAAKAAGIAVTETVTKVSSVNKIKIKLADTGFNGFEQEIQRVRLEAEKLENVYPELEAALKRLDVAMDGVYSADQAGDVKRLVAANEEYELSLKQVYSQLKLYQQAEKQAYDADILSQKKASLSSEMEIWLKENSRAAKDFGKEIRRLQASLDSLDANGVKLVGQQFKTITKQAQAMGKTGLTMLDKIKSKFAQYAAYFSVAELFMYAEQALRSMFETVKEIDTAMTGLYRVTDLTAAEYDSLFNEMISSAKEYGATLNDIINATTDWVRAGFDANTSLGLAEVTTMYQHISDLDYDTAAENLITAYNGFKDELNGVFNGDTVASVNYIADIFNELDNNFAVTSAGLGEALTRSASALDLAGNSIQETAGMITGIVEVTQDPEKAGSALKVLSLRLRGMKGQLEELGEETDENVENISKMQGQILNMTGGKVNIFDASGDFKSTYEIMQGIAEVWDDLSSIDQANLLETIAGKNRANDVAALLSNWKNVEAAVKSATEAEGSAARENAKYVDSIQGRLDKLTTTWQSFANTFMSSDFLKGAVSALTSFVEGLEKVIDTVGTFPALATIISAGFSLFKNGGIFKTLTSDLDGFITKIGIAKRSFADLTNAFKSGSTSGGLKGGLSAIKNSLSGGLTKADIANIQAYNKEIKNGTSAQTAWYRTMQTSSQSAQNLVASANGGTVALNGMKAATIGSKVALIGAKVAAIAFNAALTMGISLLITWAISGIQKLVNAKKDLAEAVEEITTKFKEQSSELKKLKSDYDTSNESSMISKYAKLSKGVDGLGRNVSLTADEYSEYQNIVNQIAEQIPSLVSGYDSQGNALLSCKGNVEELTAAYEKLIHAQNQEILTNTGNIEKDFANTLKDKNGEGLWGQFREWYTNLSGVGKYAVDITSMGMFGLVDGIADLTSGNKMTTDAAKALKDLLNTDRSKLGSAIAGLDNQTMSELKTALKDAGVDVSFWSDGSKELEETIKNDSAKIKGIVDNYYSTFAEAIDEQKTIIQAKLSEAFDVSSAISGLNYGNINEELQTIAYQTMNALDLDFFEKLSESGKTTEQWTDELLKQLDNVGKTQGKYLSDAFELQAQFNGDDIDYGDYIDKLREVESVIDGLNLKDEAKNQLKISLGLDENGVVDQYDALIKRLTSKEIGLNDKAARDFVDSLSAEELAVLVDIVPDLDAGTTIDEIKSLINDQLAQEFKFDIEVQTKGIEALNTALAESRSAAGLTSESIAALTARYEDLDGFNAAALFEKTANGIRLNSDELSRLEEQYVNTNKLEIDKNLNALVEKYQDVNNELKTNTSLTADERKELERSKESLADKIDELSTLASQYDGLTSAFTNWQNALNGAEEGDNYDSVFENLEAMKELDDKKLYGTDKYKTFAQLMSYEDLSSASIDKIGKAFDKGYKKAERYFTESKKGSTNFLNDLNKINSEWAHINKNGDWEVNINAEEAAKKLGISVEAVLLLLDKLKDYGVEVNIEDTSVDNLQTKIQQTEAKLKELGQSPVDINVDIEASSSNLGKIESEIEKAKSKIAEINNSSVSPEVKTAQLEDARAKLEALIQKKQEASQPAFMNLNTSQVNASLVDALEKIQSYQTALNELNELKELKTAGIAIDDSEIAAAEEKLDGFAKSIQGLDGDVKVAIGLEEDGSIDSIHKAFADGKVKIDADTDPALNKIEQLAENVERIEDKDVTINVTVNGLDQVKELNKQIDLATDIQGDIDKLSEYVDNAKELNKLGNNITSYVTAEVKGNVIDTKEYKLDNLKVFGESAKEVKELGTFTSKVTADVAGNVIDTKERKLDNLKVFTDSAKDIKEFEGNIISNITANTLGSVFEEKEKNIDNLKVFIDSAKGIKEIEGNIVSNITANTLGSVFENKSEEKYIDNLKTYIDSAKGIKDIEGNIISNITANTLGSVFENKNEDKYIDNLKTYVDSAKGVKDIEGNIISNITANTLGSVFENKNEEKYINNLKTFVDSAKGIKDIEGNIVSNITANTLGSVFESKNEDKYIDNLKTFVDSAKGIKEIEGDIVSNITANTLGSVFTDKERTIDNLKVFTESAKGIKDIEGDIVSNITANTLGSVFTNPEKETDNLKTFTESAKGIKDIEGDIVSNITANTLGSVFENKNEEKYIDNLKTFVDSAKGLQDIESKTVNITANTLGDVFEEKEKKIDNLKVFAEGAKALQDVQSKTVNITANTLGDVFEKKNGEKYLDNLKVFAEGAKALQSSASKTVNITANANGNAVEGEGVSGRLSSLTEFKSLVNGMTNQTVTVSVTAKVDSENVNKAIDLLKKVSDSGVFKDYKATVQIGAKVATIDDTTVKNYIATEKTAKGKVVWSNNDTAVNEFKNKIHEATGKVNWGNNTENVKTSFTATGKINWSNAGIPDLNGDGDPGWVSGTAHANGTAFKQGNWGIKGSGKALVGELGAETLVRDGKYYLIGQHGAEFIQYRPNDIIFNHLQTQELFSKGKVFSNGGRGKAFANGTAFASGTDSKAFDWFEIYIERLERVIDKLDKTVNDAYKSWGDRNDALTQEIAKVTQEIQEQKSGAEMYEQKAADVKLNESADNMGYGDLESKVRDGSINIEDYEDSIQEKINEYKELYEKQIACEDAAEELLRTQAELNAQKFDNIISQYEGILEGFEHTEKMIDEYIAQSEAKGHLVSGEYYKELIKNNDNNIIPTLIEQRDAMIAARDSLGLDKDSEKYREMSNEIDGVTQDIEAAKTQTIEWQNAIRDLEFEAFELAHERMSELTSEAEFLIELMSNKKLHNDDGSRTNYGDATLGLLAQNYHDAMFDAESYGDKAADIANRMQFDPGDESYLDPLDQNNIDKYNEYIELQRESILNAEDQKQAIKDLISEGYDKELDALQEKIDKINEAIDSQKDLYDYQKQVKEQSEEIANLEKQRAAYLNDTSESGRAKLQEITVSLKEAKDSLAETEFDRYLTQQEELLSSLYEEYELILNSRLDDLDGLVEDVFTAVEDNAKEIGETLFGKDGNGGVAGSVGAAVSDELKAIWTQGGVADKMAGSVGAIETILGDIKKKVVGEDGMVGKSDEEAKESINQPTTITSAITNHSSGSGGGSKGNGGSNGGNKSTGGDGKVKIGDKVKFLSGKYYYDSQGVNPAGSKNHGKYVYITNVNNKKWATHPIHISTGKKLGSGDLGWLKKSQISGYATGKKNFLDNEIAWTQENGKEFIVRPSDGAILTPIAKGDSVLNAQASGNIWNMANNPAEFIKDSLKLDATNVPNGSSVNNSCVQNFENITFSMPNVRNYEQLVSEMQRDPKFEKLIWAMTLDQVAGKSKLGKNKAIR